MKKFILITISIILITGCISGCADKNKKNVTTIVWQRDRDMEKYEPYFNKLLKEKGLPYELDFVEEGKVESKITVDLVETGKNTAEKPYDLTKDIREDKIIALDKYFHTEDGKKLRETLPEKVWEMYQVDGKQYTVLSVGVAPLKMVYIWDTELAKKYDIHPENWDEKIWKYEAELRKVSQGEAESNEIPFLTIEGLREYQRVPVGMTGVLWRYYPIVIREDEEDREAEFFMETAEYQECAEGIRRLYELGIYNPGLEERYEVEKRTFLNIDTVFTSKDAYLSWRPKDFWETHEVKELWSEPLWRYSCAAYETGITKESKHPEEAFRFLCALHTDADLSNALMYGEKDINYEVKENRAVKKGTEDGYAYCNFMGNQLLGYAVLGQDPNRETLYPKMIEAAKKSKIYGFHFSGEACEEELQNIFQISSEWEQLRGEEAVMKTDILIQQYRDAGIGKVIEEWNRQFRKWKAGQ